jgi:sugar lactone lactonase YvrE
VSTKVWVSFRLFVFFAFLLSLLAIAPQAWASSTATSTTLAISSGGNSVTTVTSGSVVTLTAAVTAGTAKVATGQVNFCDAAAAHCTDIHILGIAQLTSAGTATFKFRPGFGSHSYKAVFLGTNTNAASSSGASPLAVTGKYPTTTMIVATGNPGDYTLTATVASTDKGAGAVAPSGSVSFLDTSFSNTMVGTASLSSGMTGLSFLNRGAQVLGNDTWLVATGDFNGDGIPDIVVGGQTVDGVTVFLGNGDGTFTQAPNSPIALSSGALALAVGDFNRDGKADLAVLVGGTVTIYLGNGDGTFTQAPGNPTAVGGSSASNDLEAVGDFNGDGMLDLAVANGDGGAGFVTILLGNGDGTFTQAVGNPVTVGTNPISIVVGDFNGDGIPDFATANFNYTGTVSVLLGKGDGTFTQAANSPITVGGFPYAISSADFNDDGKLDLAVANSAYTSNPPGTISILLGNGDGTFTQATGSPVAVGSTPHSASIGDFNGDGIPDIAAANEGSGTTTILLGNGNGTFTPAANTPPGLGNFLESIAVADFTGGGISDLVIGAQQGSATILLSALETATATANGVAPVGVGAHNVDASYAGDSNYSASVSATTSLTAGVAVPVISPASGTFASAQPITITDSTPGATIYYQTVYNQPSQWISGNPYVQYTGPIPMEGSGTLTINAYATATGYQQSENASATYAVNFPPAPTPVISLASGSYASAQSLTISDSAAGATIYYTTNGTYPSTDSTLYAGPITVSNSEIVTAIAIASGYSSSGYARAQYYIGSSSSRFIYTIGGSYTWGYSGDGGPATFAELAGLWGGVAVDGAGNVYTADSQDNVVRKIAAGTGIITTIAGTGVAGHTGDNGPASTAELWTPSSLAVDGKGNLFIAETGDNVVRRVDAGSGTITTFAGNPTGTGSLGGPATSYPLGSISGIACDITGNLYIGESNDLVEVNAGTGNITETEIVGRAIGSTGSVFGISGIAVDSRGNIYASDEGFSVVRKITPQGVVSIFAGSLYGASGGDGGPATSARLNMPAGVAVDGAGNVYIADNFDLTIRQVNTSGIINTIAGILNDQYSAGGDGSPATDVGLWYPQVIAADAAGNVYFADQATFKIRKITAPAAPPSTAAAAPVFSQAAGTYPGAQTLTMTDATPGAEIYVSLNGSAPTTNDQGYHSPIEITGSVTVQAIALAPGYLTSAPVSATYIITTPPTTLISTVAGNNKYGFLGAGGPATSASIGQPQAVTFDAAGNLYIADPANYLVWEVSASTGNIAIVAGTGTSGNGPNGGQATATELGQPYGVAIDKSGNLYIADRTNGRIRKVATQTGVITTIAGPGVSSTLGDGGPATSAYLGTLGGIAFDKAGNLYIADSNLIVGNAFTGRVRRIDANTGIITTVAGGGPLGQLGDGGLATSAYLLYPDDLTFDAAGNLYITDSNNERIRKVNASTGIITTIAGNGAIGGSGDGDGDGGLATAAKIGVGQGITVDSNGNVYFSDPQDRVRRVDAVTNIITTIAGDGYSGYGGDGGAATMAELYNPQGLAFDASGNLYIADESNCVVRKVTFPGPAAAPTFSLKAGTYSGAQTVTISDSIQGATIYYTTDGSTPTTASTKYSGSITVSTSETLQAIAVASGYTESAVASAQYTVTIPPTFTIAGAAVSIAPGAASGNTSAITITPAGGFTGAVTLTAVLASSPAGSVDAPTLSFGATSPVTITGASNGTATLTISTTAPTTKTCTSSTQMERRAPWYTGGAAALACVLLFGGRSQRKRWRSLLGMLLLLVALSSGVLACGGGGSKVVCTGTTSPGTTAGAYTITVTGTAGALTETGTVNLTVQ